MIHGYFLYYGENCMWCRYALIEFIQKAKQEQTTNVYFGNRENKTSSSSSSYSKYSLKVSFFAKYNIENNALYNSYNVPSVQFIFVSNCLCVLFAHSNWMG